MSRTFIPSYTGDLEEERKDNNSNKAQISIVDGLGNKKDKPVMKSSDGPVPKSTEMTIRKVNFRGIKGMIGAHVDDLYAFGRDEFFRPDGK